jgi:imidazolonepropionase-like amidohydrolase
VEQALAAGVDGLAHLFVDLPADPDLAAALAKAGMVVITTISLFEPASGAALANDQRVTPYLQPGSYERLQQAPLLVPRSGPSHGEIVLQTIGLLRQAGMSLLAGTDAANPGTGYGVSLHYELARLVDAGLTPIEALAAATSVPAESFCLNDRGRIAPELQADLLLVRGDPTRDISATREIVALWRRGRPFDREAYRAWARLSG